MNTEFGLQQSEQPVVSQPTTNPQQAPSGNKTQSMIVYIILLVVLFACVASIGGFWIARQTLISTNAPTPTPTPLESPPQDPTADWKIYTNSEYAFKYPVNWTLNDLTGGQQVETYYQPDITKSVGAILVEKLTRTPGNISQYNIKKQIGNQTVDCMLDSSGIITWCYLSNSMLSFLITKDKDTTYNEILDNILSTFKFTSQNTQTTLSPESYCAKAGERALSNFDMTTGKIDPIINGKNCCLGLKTIAEKQSTTRIPGACSLNPGISYTLCSPCGNDVCDSRYEDNCNCPEDCK